MESIHFTDALLTLAFGSCGIFAAWTAKLLIAHDKKLALIAMQMSIIAKHLLPTQDDRDAILPEYLQLRRRRVKG